MNLMKKLCLSLLIAFVAIGKSFADEGMWLPMLLGQQVYKDMVKRGLKLSAEQLYSINKASIKDAIVIFGGGCTGEVVSNKGLIFTNHHCGYGNIAELSSVQNNYLRDGFYAKSIEQEISAPNLSVQFLLKIEDITSQILPEIKNLTGKERMDKYAQLVQKIEADNAKGNIKGKVYSMFKANQFLMFTYETYKDVRMVGTPPESIGKYGGDTDNWEWPRHTGDFSVWRVYMSPEGNSADYNAKNVPYKPKHFLPISLKGVKDGDYAMTYGYPGSTNRYETSYGVKLATDKVNPFFVQLRDERLKLMFEEMKKDPAVKLKLASEYAGVANYWKFFDGETKQLTKFKTFEQKQTEEKKFIDWAANKDQYKNLFADYQKIYEAWTPYAKHKVAIREGIMAPSLIKMASRMKGIENAIQKNNAAPNAVKMFMEDREDMLKNTHLISDKNILAKTLKMYYDNIDKAQQPTEFFNELEAKYGSLNEEATFKKFAEYVYANSIVLNEAALKKLETQPTMEAFEKDPAYLYFNTFNKNYEAKVLKEDRAFAEKNGELGHYYLKGIMEMNPQNASKMYPDANFTMRVSFGSVKSYKPRDGVFYDYVCTMSGIMQKYKPNDYEFDLPKRFVDLYNQRDFGRYLDPKYNDVVVSFITTNDITGGNSGSPVINGKGELIGLAFDGNYEALSHKMVFDKDLNRTICVDIRYVLWCIEVFGGAKNLIDELKIN